MTGTSKGLFIDSMVVWYVVVASSLWPQENNQSSTKDRCSVLFRSSQPLFHHYYLWLVQPRALYFLWYDNIWYHTCGQLFRAKSKSRNQYCVCKTTTNVLCCPVSVVCYTCHRRFTVNLVRHCQSYHPCLLRIEGGLPV